MKVRTTVLLLLMLCIGATLCFAADPSLGTWKLNEAKSKIDPGLPKNVTVVYEAEGNSIKSTVDGFDGKGNPVHSVWTGKFDGKDYPVTGDPNSDTRSVKRIDEHTLELTVKKGGKVVTTGRIAIAADGKSRTLTASGTNASGKKMHSTSVYDKQ
jgi:ABC-type xylose transport system substrate-binding protein